MRMAIAKADCPPLSVMGNTASVAFGPGAQVDLDLVIAETESSAAGPGRRLTLAECLGEHVRHLELVESPEQPSTPARASRRRVEPAEPSDQE